MNADNDNRRVWLEFAGLAGVSILMAALMDRRFARYRPVEPPPTNTPADTTAALLGKPTTEEKAQAEPVRQTLDRAAAQVNTPQKADQVAAQLENLAGGATTGDVEQAGQQEKPKPPPVQPPGQVSAEVAESSQRVEQAAKSAPPVEKAASGIAQAAKEITTATPGREQEALAEAAQETLNPDTQGAPEAAHPQQRRFLRQAVLKRMKPWDALDAELFLAVNHLPHNRWMNGFFRFFTFTFSGGLGWYAVLALTAALVNPHKGIRAARRIVLPLSFATTMVEFPIKTFFRRRRPFIDVIHAIVIGKKPGSWSFPSGHSAGAFAGAWLLSREFPAQRPFFYLIASLVGLSRVYLGDHYPGDVASGALSGMTIAEIVWHGEQAAARTAVKVDKHL